MTEVQWRDKIKSRLDDGLNQGANPVRGNAFNARLNDATCLGPETFGSGKNRLESAIAPRYRQRGHSQLMGRIHRIHNLNEIRPTTDRIFSLLDSGVIGPTVGVQNGRFKWCELK